MGSSPMMSLGIRAMAANYAALQTTGHNIANANVAGYSRQSVVMETSKGQFTGAGFFGKGVEVGSVTRAHNEFLTREADNAKALAAMDSTRLQALQRLEQVFQPGEAGLGHATSELFNALVDLSSRPTDLATRQVVLARANDLALRFSEAGAALDQSQANTTADLKAAVAQVNQLSTAIARANEQVASLRGSGQPANDVLDERERLISQLSTLVQVSRVEANDGSVALFIGGSQRLVLGSEATPLRLVPSGTDASRSALAIREGNINRTIDDGVFAGGSIAGLLRFQNEDLVAARNLVGQLAAAVGGAVNEQQLRGLSLQTPLGTVASQPLFGLGAAQALPQAGNQRDAGGLPLGKVILTITDTTALQASEYALRESSASPGRWEVTRLSDGQVSTIDSGDVVDGVRIDIDNAQSGDSFLLQPVSRAANGMRALLTNPLDLAAASSLMAQPAPGNAGTGAVVELRVTASPLPFPGMDETLTFTQLSPPVIDNGRSYNYSYSSSLGGVTLWNTGDPVVGANGYALQLSGVPGDGDSFEIGATPPASLATNNGNARALLALRDALIVGGRTVSDTWSQSMADMGVRVQSTEASSSISSAVANQIEQSRSSQVGVNLDEEAARLIQYQQSYQAAAKVLQVAQSLFDTLLQTMAT